MIEGISLQSSSLENVLVLLGESLFLLLLSLGGRQGEPTIFIDLEQSIGDIVVETTVHDKHDIDTRRLSQQSLFGKRIWLQQTALHSTNAQLILEVGTVQRSQVQVGRSVRDVGVEAVCPEDIW